MESAMRFLCVFAVSLLFSSCSDNSTGPGFDLSEGELNYYVSGGWIQGYHLEIEQDGLATAFGSYNDSDTLGFLKLSRQEALAAAELAEVQALTGYNAAIADYYDATGTALRRNGVRLLVPDLWEEPNAAALSTKRLANCPA